MAETASAATDAVLAISVGDEEACWSCSKQSISWKYLRAWRVAMQRAGLMFSGRNAWVAYRTKEMDVQKLWCEQQGCQQNSIGTQVLQTKLAERTA